MTDVAEDGPHVHEPCTSCGVVEAVEDGLCEECRVEVAGADELLFVDDDGREMRRGRA